MVDDELRIHFRDQKKLAFAQLGNIRDDVVCSDSIQLRLIDERLMKLTWPQLTSFAHDNSDVLRAFLHLTS